MAEAGGGGAWLRPIIIFVCAGNFCRHLINEAAEPPRRSLRLLYNSKLYPPPLGRAGLSILQLALCELPTFELCAISSRPTVHLATPNLLNSAANLAVFGARFKRQRMAYEVISCNLSLSLLNIDGKEDISGYNPRVDVDGVGNKN